MEVAAFGSKDCSDLAETGYKMELPRVSRKAQSASFTCVFATFRLLASLSSSDRASGIRRPKWATNRNGTLPSSSVAFQPPILVGLRPPSIKWSQPVEEPSIGTCVVHNLLSRADAGHVAQSSSLPPLLLFHKMLLCENSWRVCEGNWARTA